MRPPEITYRGERLRGRTIATRVTRNGMAIHSVEGIEWSYHGRGPTALAKWLIHDATGDHLLAERAAAWFRWATVSQWGARWEITAAQIVTWLNQWERESVPDDTGPAGPVFADAEGGGCVVKTPPSRQFDEALAFARIGRACRAAQKAYFAAKRNRRRTDGELLDRMLREMRQSETTFDAALKQIVRRKVLGDWHALVAAATAMREAQAAYVRRAGSSGHPSAHAELLASKRAESLFDQAVALEQQTLPGMDPEPEGGAT